MPNKWSDICPCCGMVTAFESPNERRSEGAECEHCGIRLLVSTTDPAGHYRREVDSSFSDGGLGEIQLQLHTVGTRVCENCGRSYPVRFRCCPGLIEFAIQWFHADNNRHSSVSRAKIVQFLSDHHYEAESTLRRLVHKETESDTNDESSATLDKAANDISKWISDLLAEIRP